MIAITTFSRALYERYAHRVVETFCNWPERAKLVVYSEDMSGESSERIEWRDLHKCERDLVKFKASCQPTDDYRFDAARFANKAFAMMHGSTRDDAIAAGLCFWLDADCITYRPIPEGFLESLIPSDCYLGYFGRHRLYTETGFWGVRTRNEHHRDFMYALRQLYLSGAIFRLREWHDCMALDVVRASFCDAWRLVKCVNLSGEHERSTHPIVHSALGRYIDHTKGPRKDKGHSPEHPGRWWEKEEKGEEEKHARPSLSG